MEMIKKSTVSTDKLNTLADKFKELTKENKKFTLDEMIEAEVHVEANLQEKEIIPTREVVEVQPDEGFDGLGKVIVQSIPNEYVIPDGQFEVAESGVFDVKEYAEVKVADEDLIPTNIRAGKTIFGVEGNLEPDKPDQTKEVTPTKEEQIVAADTGYELAQVAVKPIPEEYVSTVDATATANDIRIGKTAYSKDGKVEGAIEDYDGSFEGDANKWWGEDFINSVYNQYKTEENDVVVYVLDNAYDDYVIKIGGDGYVTDTCNIYFSDGDNLEFIKNTNIEYHKKWNIDKDIDISSNKIRYIVRVIPGGLQSLNHIFSGVEISSSIIGILGDIRSTPGQGNGQSGSYMYKTINLQFIDFRTSETQLTFGWIFGKLEYMRIPDTVDSVHFSYVTPRSMSPKSIAKQLSQYKFSYFKYGNSSTSAMSGWSYPFYPNPVPLGVGLSSTNGGFFGSNSNLIDLTQIPNFPAVTTLKTAFGECARLLKTSNVLMKLRPTNIDGCFSNCYRLRDVELNLIDCISASRPFYYCRTLTNLKLFNIKVSIIIGSGSLYGHILTLDSLLHTCQECIDVQTTNILTVGTANMAKLNEVYVKLTGATEEDETLPKLPMKQCESTDEGAMTISEYMLLKNWSIA